MSGRFLVIGESGLDVFHRCHVHRIAPEGPVPVALPFATIYSPGMAANVVANLLSLGATTVDTILSEPALTKTRYIDEQSGNLMLRVDGRTDEKGEWEENGDKVSAPFNHVAFRDRIARTVNGGETKWDGVLISEYGKGYLSTENIGDIAWLCNQYGIPTWLDTKHILDANTRHVTFVKLNRREYQAQLKAGVKPEMLCGNLLVTQGQEGMWWVNEDVHVPVEPVKVAEVSGAGDTALAALALAFYENGGDLTKAMEFANRAARVAVSRRGVVAVNRGELT